MTSTNSIHKALQDFAAAVTEKMSQLTLGEPEEQLRAPFENLMAGVADALGWKVVCTGETPLPDRLGRPDYAIHRNQALAGYVELKAPGFGANAKRFKGRNREQFKRFSAMPNMLYTDGNEWALYREGELAGKIVRLSGDVSVDGASAVAADDAANIERLLRGFLLWEPFIPTGRKGTIDLKGFADLLAPLTRMLRDDVTDALKDAESPLVHLARDWRQLLFPGASDEQFADAYAQTVAFALLLGRSEGADPLTLDSAENALAAQHNLLSRALQVLTDPGARAEMDASLNLLLRLIAAVPPATFTGPEDPWLYFYEEFLAAYDPKLRKDAGAYYTPVEVVRCQVRLIDDLLVNHLNMPLGFADPGVVTLDPATGTGTYLLGVIEHALKRIEAEQGAGAVAGQATGLARNLYGFELMVGPYAVAELRVSRALRDRGALLPKDGTHVYLTDTLESPDAEPLVLSYYLKPISDQHEKALKVKNSVPVIVCLGNPPYDRHEAATGENKARTGNWVRWGGKPNGADAIFRDFIDPAVAAGHGVHVKNLYNLYVYFWRWALWKVFEQSPAHGPGVVSFITGSSYLDGDAFCGMREHMRRHCDELWILDLGGEGRGTRQSDNVFAIQTPVAITIAMRSSNANLDKPATVRYARIEGSRNEKLAALDAITNFASLDWQECPDDWQAPFSPAGKGDYFSLPLLTDLMPWQHSGVQLKRTWPIGPDRETLERRWKGLLTASNRSEAFRGTGDREINGVYRVELTKETDATPIASLPPNSPVPPIQRYAYRSFDRHSIIADGRLMSRPRPDLWQAHSERQVFLSSLFSQALGTGPALTASAIIPDLDHFRGSYGAKAAIPLFRTSNASEANILPGLFDLLGAAYRRTVTPEDFLAYVYGVLAQPAFTARFEKELETRELRVPLTKSGELFEQARAIGAKLLWLHTYGERYVPDGRKSGQVPNGSARCTKAVPGDADGYPELFEYIDATRTLRVGNGEFAPVSPEAFAFEVSGLKVVQSWLKYRMKKGAGKKSSPLDDIRPERWTSRFTTELLELLWVLEATIDGYPAQATLFDAIIASDCFRAGELPAVPELMRSPKKAKASTGGLFEFEE
ncbi:DNA methyltransferase [Chlorobaculum sp. 24CR]|uniref:type ISP restriction/modification enzyme n=1 Tax=Chlorobaculum sp. 24CR TaxID=2508878 RepID=UPI00100BF433|nr:type ISP restriction/modification enzyme [Chlorobaculum sp. 24CR]RXK85153.1 DNA methyltransferase [Chlorobaculum sp. 24CR]